MVRQFLDKMKLLIPNLLSIVLFPNSLKGENEAHFRDLFANEVDGKVEVILPDNSRCDIVTETHAIEVEYASKWCEALGQSLWYGFQQNSSPGIVLILRRPEDRRFVIKLKSLLIHRKIDDVTIWSISTKGEVKEELSNNEKSP